MCDKHGSATQPPFCLHGRGRSLLSHQKGRGHIKKETTAGMPEQIHSLCLQILWHSGRWNLLQQGSCLIPTLFPLTLCLPGRADPSLAPPWVCSQACPDGDQEARPLPALAAQRWPFPSNSTIPPLPNRTCPDTFTLSRIALKSLGLPTHVKGTAGGEKRGKPARAPARVEKGSRQQGPHLSTCNQWKQGCLLEQQCTPRLPNTDPFQKSSSSCNIWLFKPGLSILAEVNYPEVESLTCQSFIATALQLQSWGSGGRGGGSGRRDGHSGMGVPG